MDKELAKKIVDSVAQDLSQFKFGERHDNVTGNIVGLVKKSWNPLNSEQEALDKPIGDLPVGTKKDRDLEVDNDDNPVHTKTEPRRIKYAML